MLRRMLVEAAVFGALASRPPGHSRCAGGRGAVRWTAPQRWRSSACGAGLDLDRLPHLFAGYWDAPIFHPDPYAFALSEPMPLQGIAAAPVTFAGGSLVTAYNVVLLACLVATGLAAAGCCSAWVAVAGGPGGGAMLVMLPPVHANLDVLPLATLAASSRRWRRSSASGASRAARGLALGVALGVTYVLCGQYAVLLTVVLLLAGWTLCDRQVCPGGRRQPRRGRARVRGPRRPGGRGSDRRAAGARAVAPGRPGGKALGRRRALRARAWPQLVPLPAFTCPTMDIARISSDAELLLCLAAIRWSRDRRWTRSA